MVGEKGARGAGAVEETAGNRAESPSAAARRRAGISLSSSSSSSSPSSCRQGRRTVLYAGDGENDLCPALCLRPGDSLLVRRGRGLERLLRERAAEKATATAEEKSFSQPNPLLSRALDASLSSALTEGARAFVWDTAEELRALVEALLLLCEERAAGE